MPTALTAGAVVIAAASALSLLLAATAAPAIRSGRRSEAGNLPLVTPAGSGFGDASAIVAACAARRAAAERTSPAPRPAARRHRSIRPTVRSTVHLAA